MAIVQPDGAQKVYLHAVTHLARDTCAFEFRPVGEATLAPFTAGAHVDLILPNGVRRSYSLCNPQGETHRYVVGVKKASPSRGASAYLHETVARRDRDRHRPAAQQLSAGRDRAAFGADRRRNRHHADLGHDPAPERDRRVVRASLRVADARRGRFPQRFRKPPRRSVAAEAHLRSRAGRQDARSSLDRQRQRLRARISTPAGPRRCSKRSKRLFAMCPEAVRISSGSRA